MLPGTDMKMQCEYIYDNAFFTCAFIPESSDNQFLSRQVF